MPVGAAVYRRSVAATVAALAAGGLVGSQIGCRSSGQPGPVAGTTPSPQGSKSGPVPGGSAPATAAGSGSAAEPLARQSATLSRSARPSAGTPSRDAGTPGRSAGTPGRASTPSANGSPPQRGRGGLPPVITKIKTKDPVVFITIDDGWVKDPRFAEQVRDRRVPITVFLTDAAARPGYDYFRRLQDAGAVIENHTMTHAVLSDLSRAGQRAEICRVQGIYADRYGTRPTLLRPPYGAYNKTTRKVAAACGIRAIVNWTAEYKSATRRMYYQDIRRLHRGDIILWHFDPEMPSNFDRLLRIIRRQHLRPAALHDYLHTGLPNRQPKRPPGARKPH